jgi:hypothetical protein
MARFDTHAVLKRAAGLRAAVCMSVALLCALPAPEKAAAGGTAVVAPERLDAEACRQGAPAPTEGVRLRPVPPTVIGCLELEEDRRALAAVYRFDPPATGGGPQICFFVAPRGEVEVDGPCTSRWTRHKGGLSNALTGAAGFSAVSVRRVGGEVYPRSPTTTVVSGLARGPRRIAVHSGSCEPAPGNFFRWAGTIRIGPRLARRLGSSGPFTFFAAAIPRGADPCRPVEVSAAGRGAERWGIARAARRGYLGPASAHCNNSQRAGRTPPFLRALIEPLRNLLAVFRP